MIIQGTKGINEEYNIHFSREEIEIKTPENTMEIIKSSTVTGLFVLFLRQRDLVHIRAMNCFRSDYFFGGVDLLQYVLLFPLN